VDAGEPVASATKTWLLPVVTRGQITGGGHAPSADGSDEIAFGFNAKSDADGPRGNGNAIDQAAGVHIKCVEVTSLIISGTHATIFGNGTINQAWTTLRIDVDDLAESGAGHDQFRIVADNGYVAGGILTGGNIQIKGAAPSSEACLQVTVRQPGGSLAAAAGVTVFNSSFNQLAQGVTDGNGVICFARLPINTGIIVQAQFGVLGGFFQGNTGAGGGSCASGTCVPATITVSSGQD
jgi:hypothetical protein